MKCLRHHFSLDRGPRSKKRRGAAAVEMAFVLPVFVILMLGIIEVGRGIMVCQILETAARNGARMAILQNSSNSQVTSSAQSYVGTAANVAASNVTVTIAVDGSSGASLSAAQPGQAISVTVSVPAAQISWLPPNYLKGMNLTALAVMYHE